ncbi:DMT family transporter [Microbacterium aurantiacum]|nr:DMT family transporter [Microbacterium chocolatum]
MTARMPDPAVSRFAGALALGGAVLVGVLTALQARVNGQLGVRFEDGFVAAAVSFSSGLVLVVAVCLLLPAGRAGLRRLGAAVRAHAVPWWMFAGGAAGAFSVATQGLTVGIIGVALYTVGSVAGGTVAGLVLDRVGYAPGGVMAVTVPRLIGGALAVGAVALALTGPALRGIPWWMPVLPFFVGAGIAWQQATNGRLRQRIDSALVATLVNFAGGTLLLLVVAGVHVALSGPPAPAPTEVWVYVGGALGVAYIFLSAAIVQRTGVLLLGLGVVVGQLVSSLLIDLVWPAPGTPGTAEGAFMIALALASVAVATARPRRRRRR